MKTTDEEILSLDVLADNMARGHDPMSPGWREHCVSALTHAADDLRAYRTAALSDEDELTRVYDLVFNAGEIDASKTASQKVAALVEEREQLRDSLILACELQRASHDNARQLSAMRHVANSRSSPFSHKRVQKRYEEYVQDKTPRPPSTTETDYLRKLHDFMKGYAEECDGVPSWVPAALAVLTRLTGGAP